MALTIVSISYFVQKFVIAVMMIEFLKRKTSMPYVISAMQTMKFPNAVAIPFIVILRYMPTLREDYGYLKDSLKIRGIRTSGIEFFIHPIRSLEFMIVPILFRSIRVAEELSTSVLLRGIENYKNRTNIYPLKFTKIDAGYALFTVIAVSMLCYLQF
ncbi:MAG: energy-coupling factor transporter transmembrane component T [[Actinobacillus] rossii]|nr:energy-coupling factor transporter transmembrane protein EcfT [[Actinobacillus] rossii]MDY4507019.1 energy-coupling factor transporter transmembrane component T [[Actinobacillus] rossii]